MNWWFFGFCLLASNGIFCLFFASKIRATLNDNNALGAAFLFALAALYGSLMAVVMIRLAKEIAASSNF